MGTSAGGVQALQEIFSGWPSPLPVPVAVVQHISDSSQVELDMVFGRNYRGPLIEAMDKEQMRPGSIYFAPSGYHMLVEKDLSLSLSQDEPVYFARPSIDVFMESAAQALGPDCIGVLLTGANEDGARGLKAVQECGGTTLVQDPQSAAVPTMPQAAVNLMKPDYVLSLRALSNQLLQIVAGENLT
jgi:two-component system chemotaxis response regulator CheB